MRLVFDFEKRARVRLIIFNTVWLLIFTVMRFYRIWFELTAGPLFVFADP